MMNAPDQHRVTGKIRATPNPVPPGVSRITISWESSDVNAEVRVATGKSEERLVSKGAQGQTEVSWIAEGKKYDFRLYGTLHPETPLDSVTVSRTPQAMDTRLSTVANQLSSDNLDNRELAEFIARAVPRCLARGNFRELFLLWQRNGFHVTPVHFYQPIPDTRTLTNRIWEQPSELVGIDMNGEFQLNLLRNAFPRFRHEYEQFPSEQPRGQLRFYLNNGLFDGTDALVAYCMIRHFRPRLIIEVGSGFSSLITAEAVARDNQTELICIEPYPRDFLRAGFPGLRALIEQRVEELDLDFFLQLEDGDVLFVDSSHTVKIGGDVNYLFLEVIPRLKPGVIIHVHDIMLPFDYRRDWVLGELRFWTEQYLLQAFLSYNSDFEVLMANSYLAQKYMAELKATFRRSPWWGGGSFWMRRRSRIN